jgi:phenylalanyl-tRNA synthetase alpha chain
MSQAEGAVRAIEEGLAGLGSTFEEAFAAAPGEVELRAAHAKLLGKKGDLTAVLARLRDVAPADRPAVGAKVNAFKEAVEAAFQRRLKALGDAARIADLRARPFDLSLPAKLPFGSSRGHAHPILQVQEELLAIFRDLGFRVARGPEIELESNNFTKLAFPPDHPATDMQDSFWLGPEVLLRTHTSNVQVREMTSRKPPLAVVSAGAVYRRDDDVTHSPMFHQLEGFLIDERVSFAELKGVLTAFAERLYGAGTPARFRPSYFPFVEPGAEVDVGCVFCSPSDGTRAACRVCKGTGWLEIGGCGMVHPEVFRHCGLDPETTTGFAFGMGIDRMAMLKFGIPNIRLLFENDPRFLSQF